MRLRDVPRMPTMSRSEFAAYIAEPASPLVLDRVMDGWPAMERWTFDFFARAFPTFPVRAYAPQFPSLARWGVKTTLAHYVDYLCDPAAAAIEGEWFRGDPDSLRESDLTLYAGDFNPAHPVRGNRELVFRDVPQLLDLADSWLDLLDPAFRARCERKQSHHFVYLSATGGVTPLHHDFWTTHAFLAQVMGRKHAYLFEPSLARRLYRHETGDVQEMLRDPAYDEVDGWFAELTPGDLLVIPACWLHYVETHEASITYSADWIDTNNWRSYVAEATKALAVAKR